MKQFWRQSWTILAQGLRAEIADVERLVSPLLFALTLLLLFSFALSETDPALAQKIFVAETYLTIFFALQIAFSRVFEPDREDRVFDLMRSYPITRSGWFVAKYIQVFTLGTVVLLPTLFFAAVLGRIELGSLLSWPLLLVALLALAGLSALGVLVSALTLKANARQILYPLLYFPLTIPVLLSAIETSVIVLENDGLTETAYSWLGLLSIFDVVYLTIGTLTFGEIIDS